MLTQKDESGRMSKPIVRVAVAGISIGITVMILTIAVVQGFQDEIRNKVTGFGAHIQISPYDSNFSLETDSLNRNQPTVEALKSFPGIRHIQPFAIKAGIIKSKDQLLGVMLKGIDKDFDWEFFGKNLKEGEVFTFADTTGDRVLISEYMANKLELAVGKKVKMFFLSDGRSRARSFTISGIYNTGLTEGYDDKFVLCDMRQVQTLNHWDSSKVAGFEVLLDETLPVDDGKRLTELTARINDEIDYSLVAENIRDLTPAIFSWLDVLDTNALIIIVLMIFVGMINMISALMILILDRTNMIGTLKALGAKNWLVMKIFLRNGGRMIVIGTIIGNVAGLGLCFLQKYTGLVGLDEESYYVKVVPIHIVWSDLLLLNISTVIICTLALLLPAMLVTKISPVRALRFS